MSEEGERKGILMRKGNIEEDSIIARLAFMRTRALAACCMSNVGRWCCVRARAVPGRRGVLLLLLHTFHFPLLPRYAPLSILSETASIAHLPPRFRRSVYAIMTLGPDRPQPDVSPLAGKIDAGDLSAMLGGGDKPYGTGYSSLVSNELCLTTEVIKPGAEVSGWAGARHRRQA